MYYVWRNQAGNETEFFQCGIEQFEGWYNVSINMGKPVDNLPKPLNFYCDGKIEPEDFPVTNTQFWFLISSKIKKIFDEHVVSGVEYFQSEIVNTDSNKKYANYWTCNILNIVDCIDWDKSETENKFGIMKFKKLVLNNDKLPSQEKLFLIHNKVTLQIVHKDIVDACNKAGVTGIDFIPVEEFKGI